MGGDGYPGIEQTLHKEIEFRCEGGVSTAAQIGGYNSLSSDRSLRQAAFLEVFEEFAVRGLGQPGDGLKPHGAREAGKDRTGNDEERSAGIHAPPPGDVLFC